MHKVVLLGALMLGALQASACDVNGHTGFLPENDLRIGVNDKMRNDMTEERFNEIIDEIDAVYNPIVSSHGGKLKWNRDWKNETVNASAQRFFRSWKVNMYGGLARHPHVTDDAFAMVVCHELGHHLAGAPQVGGFLMKWASNEGQSDYFAATKCFRKVYSKDNNESIVSKMEVPAMVNTKCSDSFSHPAEQALCIRTAMAGKHLALLLGSLRDDTQIDFDMKDPSVVDRTDNAHPKAQCRLDTYFAGSLCDKKMDDDFSSKDPQKGACTRAEGYIDSVRPLCWYKPEKL